MMHQPKVSVVVSTKNEAHNIVAFCKSVRQQTYADIELIVVDNHSNDNTQSLATHYADTVLVKGPERSSQRNYGVRHASGDYVAIFDADMILDRNVIRDCVDAVLSTSTVVGVVIPEVSIGSGFWAKCKALEKRFYQGVPWMEAARFFKKSVFLDVGEFNEHLISGEDWDLSQRIQGRGAIIRIHSVIYHNEGKVSLLRTAKKKYYYAKHISKYLQRCTHQAQASKQMNVFLRYWLFFRKPTLLFRNPFVGFGMLLMKTLEYAFGGIGYAVAACAPRKRACMINTPE